MPRFAVGHISFMDHELRTELIYASDWKAALTAHSKVDSVYYNDANSPEEAKRMAFDSDEMVDVIEINEK